MRIRKTLGKYLPVSIFSLQRKFLNRQLIIASSLFGCVLILRFIGVLQPLELAALDKLFQFRPIDSLQDRISIVAIDEASLQKFSSWPIPDNDIAELLEKIKSYNPRVIGLDIYRDLSVKPDNGKLKKTFKSTPNLIGIELFSENKDTRVKPPEFLKQQDRVGVNNIIPDTDGKVRRGLLFLHGQKEQNKDESLKNETHKYESFALKVALLYLEKEKVTPERGKNPQYLQLGKAEFPRFRKNDGGYVNADDGGYQFLSNFPRPACEEKKCDGKSYGFPKIPVTQFIEKYQNKDIKIDKSLIENRIILIGSTAKSLNDFKLTPYSSRFMSKELESIAGVELQAYFIHEIISASLENKELLKVWSKPVEFLWIALWAYLGATTRWYIRSSIKNLLLVFICVLVLTFSAYLFFLKSWWIPFIPALLTYLASVIGITGQIAHMKEELQRTADELKDQEGHLRYMAYHDALTGLPNRKAFTEKLDDSLSWAESSNSLLALLFVDLDGFKQVNDSLGHEIGDLLLIAVAQRLNNCLRGSDTVSRLGGDEFTIILRTIPKREVAGKIADKILKSITEPISLQGHNVRVSASIGISIYPNTANNPEILLRQADAAMYDAKKFGKNCYKFAD